MTDNSKSLLTLFACLIVMAAVCYGLTEHAIDYVEGILQWAGKSD